MNIRSVFIYMVFSLICVSVFPALNSHSAAGASKDNENLEKVERRPRLPHIYWGNDLHLDGQRENVEVKIGGSIILDVGNIDPDDELKMGFPDLEGSNVDLRKTDVDIRGTLLKSLEFRINIDLANVNDIKDIWFRFTNYPFLDHIKFGTSRNPSP